MDGANNIYFWDNGTLHGYQEDGERLFEKKSFDGLNERSKDEKDQSAEGPEQFIRLILGPDGTIWANNKNGRDLYAFKPSYGDSKLTLEQEDIQTDTVYRTAGELAVGGVTVKSNTRIWFQAQKGMSFAKGFAVQKGASLLCRTGF